MAHDTECLTMGLSATFKLSHRLILFANARNLINSAISRYSGDKDVSLYHYR